jgi:DNA-binding NtrC family response regulator
LRAMSTTRTILADPSPATRTWLRTALPHRSGEIIEVASGWEILWHLAEEPVDLVVSTIHLKDAQGHQVLAMARTAGVLVPFVLVSAMPNDVLRKAVRRAENAGLVESWPDGAALRREVARLTQPEPIRQREVKNRRLLDGARALALRTLAQAS